jgi:enoyl-CoA hydratase/carnithine racemase
VAFATPDALFGLTEVRVGVAPTPISTHMVNAMGLRHTRRYALTGERFDAQEALRIGLVHEVVPADQMEAKLAGGAGRDIPQRSRRHRHDEAVVSWRQRVAAGRAADGDAGARKLDAAVLAGRP